MPCDVELFIFPPLSNTPEDLSLWRSFMDKVKRMSEGPKWRRFMRYDESSSQGPKIIFYDGTRISDDSRLNSLFYDAALSFRRFRYQLVGPFPDDLIDLYNHLEALAKSVFCPARQVDGGVEYSEQEFYSLDEMYDPTPPCLRCGHWRITNEPGDEELYNDAALKVGVKSEGLCRTCEVHGITQSLKVIGEICVQYDLPAGDPCWMAKMIGSYADWRVEPPRQPFIPMRPPACTYFLRGACHFGDRCRHAHPDDRKLGHCKVHPPAFAIGRTFYDATCTCGKGSTCDSIPWPHGPH